MKLILGDSLHKLSDLPTCTVDAVVTDPPYGLAFMGKRWDYDVPSVELWREVWRVMKPGAHLLSFGGTRTYHRMVCAIEDAGFEIRDQVMWIYGSGFPKSLDVSKAIDKAAGAEREVIGVAGKSGSGRTAMDAGTRSGDLAGEYYSTAPATEAAKRWQGWGTALKPANEPIVLARKPLEKGLTVAENVLKWGTGALNVDASRIAGVKPQVTRSASAFLAHHDGRLSGPPEQGRWPANVLFDEAAAAVLDEQSGVSKSPKKRKVFSSANAVYGDYSNELQYADDGFGDCGGASRFFYVAKASKRERHAGLEFADKPLTKHDARPQDWENADWKSRGGNHHPTVKPVKLMEYLVRMITPPGGIVLDPFMGSGTTGCAAARLGFQFIGIEREPEYIEIARKRIEHWQSQPNELTEDDDQLSFPEVPA